MNNISAYPSYKQSGVQWLGDIPSHWDILSIKRLSQVKRGASPRPIDNPDYFDDSGEYAWVRIADVTASNMYLFETTQRLSDFGKSFSVPLEPNNLFLSIAGTVGKPIITKIKACIHDGFVYFPEYKNDTKFLYYIFVSGQPYLGLGKMGTQLNLNTDTVGAIKIGLPPIDEQTAIAHYLDRETAKIDALLQKQAELLAKLSEKRTALITHAVTKGLNPNVPMKNSGVQWLGDIPSHWEVKRLKHLGEIVLGLTYSPDDTTTDMDCTLVLRSSNIQNNRLVFDDNVYVNKTIPKKMITTEQDILICSRNGSRSLIGKCALIEGNGINQTFGAFMTVYRTPYRKLIYYVLNSDIFKAQLGSFLTSTINQLTTQVLGGLKIAFPPPNEQTAIANYLDTETAKIDALCDKIRELSERLTEYRTTLISDAVTGKIKVIP